MAGNYNMYGKFVRIDKGMLECGTRPNGGSDDFYASTSAYNETFKEPTGSYIYYGIREAASEQIYFPNLTELTLAGHKAYTGDITIYSSFEWWYRDEEFPDPDDIRCRARYYVCSFVNGMLVSYKQGTSS